MTNKQFFNWLRSKLGRLNQRQVNAANKLIAKFGVDKVQQMFIERWRKRGFMRISEQGKNLIHHFESFRSRPYLDGGGVPTIGWGATYYPNGKRVRMSDPPITREYADWMFEQMIGDFERFVNRKVKTQLTQHQFDALVSFCYNVGKGQFASSTLLRRINNRRFDDIPRQLNRWVNDNGRRVNGLVRRRKSEGHLFATGQVRYFT